MATATLSDIPKSPHELEDYVASLFQSARHFVEKNIVERALKYHHLVNNGIFFVKDVRERLTELYDAYKVHPKLSLGVAIEIDGGRFDPEAVDPRNALIREAMISGRRALLQECFYLEHRARLSILKAAIDYVSFKEAGLLPAPLGGRIDFDQLLFEMLPASFHDGLNRLKTEPYFRRYALFWQVFLWGFGGFYLKDRKEVEFEWLAEQTGVPVEEIPRALRAFDVLFPTADSWVTEAGPSQCMIVL